MLLKRIVLAAVLTLLAGGLFGQGLTTTASPTDWEEINFEFDSAILSDGYPSLLRLAELLKANPDYRVRVVGHTDYVGSSIYNNKLALSRANAVRDFLVKYGAAANQITTSGEGKNAPTAPNQTKEGRFMNRRVVLTVTDGQGRVVGAGGVGDAIGAFDKVAKAQEACCTDILKRLEKLDDILAAEQSLKTENDRLRDELAGVRKDQAALQQQVATLPEPVTQPQAAAIAKAEGERVLEEQQRRNRKFSLLGVNIGPTYGDGRTGDFTFSGSGRYFSPFGGDGTRAVQAQGEYMYYPGRMEGQFDIGLVNRWRNFQAGAFGSFKYLNLREFQNGGSLAQGALTLDWLFSRGKVGVFGTKGFKYNAVLNREQIGPNAFLETFARIVNQVGASATVGLAGDTYLEGNLAYLQAPGGGDRAGANLRYVHPINDFFAFTAEAGLNETLLNYRTAQAGRVVFGVQMGNFLRPKDFTAVKHPVPVDVPRVRYQLMTRRVGNSSPVADAGPDQIGVAAGQVILNGSGSRDPEGDALTFQWQQIAGPAVALSGATSQSASFTAAANQSYSFRLTVTDSQGFSDTDTVTVSTQAAAATRIASFTAEPRNLRPGESTRLNWLVEGAESVTISPEPGAVDPNSGNVEVTPSQTTTYTLTATGPDGQPVTATVVVTVSDDANVPRILSFSSNPPYSTASGAPVTLSWATDSATSVVITGTGVPAGTLPLNGSIVVNPITNSTYTLTAYGPEGSVSSVLYVFVR